MKLRYMVLIVPMRNWNRDVLDIVNALCPTVLIVPMRNWNTGIGRSVVQLVQTFWSYLWGIETKLILFHYCIIIRMFWSYLWGIETSSRAVRGDPRLCRVLIVPMRNWNRDQYVNLCEPLPYVLIVPMRNWNRTTRRSASRRWRFWSYLWGIETRLLTDEALGLFRFDRTYEELKPSRCSKCGRGNRVLIVPMRNWN
mgnify:CR=1 FL=1